MAHSTGREATHRSIWRAGNTADTGSFRYYLSQKAQEYYNAHIQRPRAEEERPPLRLRALGRELLEVEEFAYTTSAAGNSLRQFALPSGMPQRLQWTRQQGHKRSVRDYSPKDRLMHMRDAFWRRPALGIGSGNVRGHVD